MQRFETGPYEATRVEPISRTEVLDNLISHKGISMKERALEIHGNENIQFIMIFGPPESGKTTASIQLARYLAEHPTHPRPTGLMTFDDAITQARERYKMIPIPYWGAAEWRTGSLFYLEQIENRLREKDPEKLIIIENVGYGDTDRGISTTLNLASRHKVDGFFWGLVQHPAISRQAVATRHLLMEEDPSGSFVIPDDQVIDFLRINNLLITGTGTLSTLEAGRKVREIVAKMDLTEEEQLIADTEEKEEILVNQTEQFESTGFPSGVNRLSERREGIYLAAREAARLQGTRVSQLPEKIRNSGISSLDAEEMNFQANHLRIFGAKLGLVYDLSYHRYDYFFNGLINDKPIHYLDLEMLSRR